MRDKPAAAERGEYRYQEFGNLVIHSVEEDGSHVVTLFGELRVESAEHLQRELERIELHGAEEILVDLSGLHFIDSIGLRVLLHADARARASSNRVGAGLTPAPPTPPGMRVRTGRFAQHSRKRR